MKYINDFVGHFIHDWHHNKFLFFGEATAISCALLAATIIAVMGSASPFLLCFVMYLIGSILMMITGHIRGSGFLVILNIGFTIINVIGISSNI